MKRRDTWRPTRLLRTLPRSTYFGPIGPLWTRIQLGPETAWVSGRFSADVAAADVKTLRGPFA